MGPGLSSRRTVGLRQARAAGGHAPGSPPRPRRAPGPGLGAKSARAFDATFSAPKSVSVLWALSPDAWVRAEVLAAHDAAVFAALDWLERHGGVTRRGKDGVYQVDIKGLVAALFRQHTSRDVDPQLHTHAVVWAKVQDLNGKWLSLDARFLKQQQRSIGWVYAAALRSELSARLGVSWGQISEGHADIAAVPDQLLQLFSQRNAQVDARLGELVAAWVDDHDGAEPDPRALYRLERTAVLDSRPGKSEPIEADQLRCEWLARAQAAGFEAVVFPDGSRRLVDEADDDAVITQALEMMASSSSTGYERTWPVRSPPASQPRWPGRPRMPSGLSMSWPSGRPGNASSILRPLPV